jgi:hypothetical protein
MDTTVCQLIGWEIGTDVPNHHSTELENMQTNDPAASHSIAAGSIVSVHKSKIFRGKWKIEVHRA